MTTYYNTMISVKCEWRGSERAAFPSHLDSKDQSPQCKPTNQSFLMKAKGHRGKEN